MKLIPPAYVKPYVKRGKSDAVDAAATCEAVNLHQPDEIEATDQDVKND